MNFINPKIKNCDENTIRTMNIVLSERKKGKSRKKCAEIAKIKPQRIQNWYNEGKNVSVKNLTDKFIFISSIFYLLKLNMLLS